MCTNGSQGLTSIVCLNYSPPYFLRQGLSLILDLTHLARLEFEEIPA